MKGLSNVWMTLARCCNPLPGEEVSGFVLRTGGVAVHLVSCANLVELSRIRPAHIVEVEWAGSWRERYNAVIQVDADGRPALLSDVIAAVAALGVRIRTVVVPDRRGDRTQIRLRVEITGRDHLDRLLAEVRKVDGVVDAVRPPRQDSF
jgi:GTP pyrophosphokinase